MPIAGLGDILIIDDFYERPDAIADMLDTAPAPPWKIDTNSRNYKDYLDCRLILPVHKTLYDKRDILGQLMLWRVIEAKFGVSIKPHRYDFIFNLFQWINPPGQNHQFYPHADGADRISAIIYLNRDEDSSGGTAFYRDDADAVNASLGYFEHNDLRVDIDRHCNLAGVVPARFNRCILFPGGFTHGGYVADHHQYTGQCWRQNQVYFFDIDRLGKPLTTK